MGTKNAQTPAALEPAVPEPAVPEPAVLEPAVPEPAVPEPAAAKSPAESWEARRAAIAGADEKMLKRLSRYASEDDAIKAGVAAQTKISEMTAAKPLAKDASEEEVAAWREANGIPLKAEDYKIELEGGLVVGDADKPAVDTFLAIAHQHNLMPEVANAIIAGQLKLQDEFAQEQTRMDTEAGAAMGKEMKEVWGSDYVLRTNEIEAMLAAGGVRDELINSRLPDGTPVGYSPKMLKWLSSLAQAQSPAAKVVGASGTNANQSLEGEIATIEKLIREGSSEYYKGAAGLAMQAKYQDLLSRKLGIGS